MKKTYISPLSQTVALETSPLLTMSPNSKKPGTNVNKNPYNDEFSASRYEDWDEEDEEDEEDW